MSEQWYAIKHSNTSNILDLYQRESDVYEIIRNNRGSYYAVSVTVTENNAEPCEWELSPFGEQDGKPSEKTWGDFIKTFGHKYCPECGRKLEEK